MTAPTQTPLDYKAAGVDINLGNEFIERIKPLAKQTPQQGVVAGIGGFGALFSVPWKDYEDPLLVSSTDGVGTKLKLAIELQKHDTIGIDLVAMCANDISTCGAKPLFFLDYYATGALDLEIGEAIIRGIAIGCQQADMALIGGETAEMPGMYQHGDYDLAGFCVGIVDRAQLLGPEKVRAQDTLIGVSSSGPHANGYSLIRKIISTHQSDLHQTIGNQSLGEALLTPTRIYCDLINKLQMEHSLHALAHITGGGLLENVPRVLPKFTQAQINPTAWKMPEIFEWITAKALLAPTELFRTFNAGIGLVIIAPKEEAPQILKFIHAYGYEAWEIGQVVEQTNSTPNVSFECDPP